ncbi:MULTISPECIES: cation diffusion facilitator family transporter [Thiomicrorhabdus]|uniref:Cation diffusion facilitator family transporter n=1 Tax=Thiomicrorhabdus heinhorstiae TaxID=2748010 RepID=A0ABS0BYQ7_9GAMM|nr:MULTISPECIES: cation diffusion facilitator family transporter [Thiomicrorhabdus]MBF6058932.1 cation diffusion facilitator family transporter [Thiomicrorhabdus heinhorstiae]
MNKRLLVRAATYASVGIAVFLLILKLTAWLRTDSVSILASLLDSALDTAASVMIAVAVHIAQTPPDKEHRFGHGKAEPLAALAQSVFISGSAAYLIIYSIDRIIEPQVLSHTDVAIWYMITSLILTLCLIAFQQYVIKKTESTAIEADSMHYISDVMANLLIILSLLFSQWTLLDPVLALLIGLWILRSAIKIGNKAANQLLDHELPEEMRQAIQNTIMQTPRVRGFNDLRTYQSGPNRFVQLDLELDDDLSLMEAHAIAENVTEALRAKFDHIDVIIHQEPVSLKHDPQHHTWGKE